MGCCHRAAMAWALAPACIPPMTGSAIHLRVTAQSEGLVLAPFAVLVLRAGVER